VTLGFARCDNTDLTELNGMPTGNSPKEPEDVKKTPEQLFTAFHYAEVKDLAKHFLTLIAGVLVLSVSFSDKIVPFDSASRIQKCLLAGCWLGLLASFVLAGFGLFMNYLAAEQAQGGIIYDYKTEFRALARRSYALLDIAAMLFALSLGLLAATAMTRFLLPTPSPAPQSRPCLTTPRHRRLADSGSPA
jgi:hypothetical protein